jgi:hypothetical protein
MPDVTMSDLLGDILVLVILAMPVAAVTWTVTHEEILREPREYFQRRSRTASNWWVRKLFYGLTCEYCFSHWVTLALLATTRFTLVYSGWRGYLIAGFSLVWVANLYMTAFVRLRLEVREERLEIARQEADSGLAPTAVGSHDE